MGSYVAAYPFAWPFFMFVIGNLFIFLVEIRMRGV